ncbi:MAG TPA: hypothetical protein ENN73_03825, partial [Firmicutes bacterium]|nr:hypothetical protein [Bacillota bacterium]
MILAIVLVFCINVFGGEISAELKEYINTRAGKDELIPIVIHMSEQLDTKSLANDLRAQRARKDEIQVQILTSLQNISDQTQADIRTTLEKDLATGRVTDLSYFWIFNGITLNATPEMISKIAARSDVKLVREQLNIYLIQDNFYYEPAGDVKAEVKDFGVKQIRANEMWALGYKGDGIIVANFDTGVNLNHKDLKNKWLGNERPASQCWFDPWTSSTQPVDGGTNTWQHGTHTMATIVGDDVSGGVHYGVAPNAKWIAARMFSYDGNASEANTIKCFQWIANPDGNTSTSSDIPHLCNHSWGATNPYTGAGVCDSSYYTYIDNCENLGIIMMFSAGNNGTYGSKTIGSPASRITTYLNAFAIGASDSSRKIGSFSSRGPSPCDGSTIKPEVTAPGVQVWSADGSSTTGYKYGDGTSMACPHAIGAAALLLQYKPDATVEEIKKALYYTATYGTNQHGEDNNFGRGIIDVMAAKDYLQPAANPSLDYVSNYIDDSSGNGNGFADPGETIQLRVTIKNTGAQATGITGTLSESDPYVSISDNSATFPNIATNGTGTTNSPHFTITIQSGCPVGHIVQFNLNLTSNSGTYSTNKTFTIQVGSTVSQIFDSTDTPKAIPDNNTTGITSIINLSNIGTITDVNVYLNISHTYKGDLKVSLTSPEGTEIMLHNRSGGSTDNIIGWYDTAIPEDGPGKLSDLIGQNGSGQWKIKVSDNAGQDTGTLNSWRLELFYYGQPSDTTPPAAITNLNAVSGNVEGTVILTWTSPGDDGTVGQASKYTLKYNTVNITSANWNSSTEITGLSTPKTAGSAETVTVSGLTPGQLYYFAIKTEDEIPNISDLSNVPSATAKQAHPILLVDDDDGATLETYYTAALNAGGFSYDTWNVKNSGSPASEKLQSYQYVIWFTGADYKTTLTATDETNLKTYLTNGGRLFFISHDYLYQITGGTDGNITRDFPKNYLKIDSCDNDVGDSYETSAVGIAGDPIGNGLSLSISTNSPITNYADSVFSSTASPIFNNGKGEPCGLRYDNGTYRVVTLVFPFENITSSTDRNTVMNRVMTWLQNGGGISDTTPPSAVTNLAANPGAQAGVITLTWTAPGDDGNVGQASQYMIKYNTVQITESNWNASSNITGIPTPKTAGSAESLNISGFTPGQVYYFALKTNDEVPNTSNISNSPSATAPGSQNEFQVSSTDTPKSIPDNNSTGVTSTINVAQNYTIAEVLVYVNIKHTYRGDLRVVLTSPTGKAVTLHNRGGGSADNIIGWYPSDLTPSGPGALNDFTGEPSAGAWKLKVDDNYSQDTGTLDGWTLKIIYNGGGVQDQTPPANITNLTSYKNSDSSVNLKWTAPGDDGNTGTADHYVIKYNTVNITESNWGSSTAISNPPAPAAAGSQQSCIVNNLTQGQTYYFGIKTYDEAGNYSGLSNITSIY